MQCLARGESSDPKAAGRDGPKIGKEKIFRCFECNVWEFRARAIRPGIWIL